MELTIHGPNLFNQSKGDFHVHATGCSDNAKEVRNNGSVGPWITDADSVQAVIEEIYADFIFDNDEDPWTAFETSVYFAPCTKALTRFTEANPTNIKETNTMSTTESTTTTEPTTTVEPKVEPTTDLSAAKQTAKTKANIKASLDAMKWPSRVRSTGTLIGLFDNREKQFDSTSELPWFSACTEHGTTLGHPNLKLASAWRSKPEQWCPTCISGDTPKAKAKAEADAAKAAAKATKAAAKPAAAKPAAKKAPAKRVSKATKVKALVDGGLADNAADAKAQLADMGE